MKAFAVELPPGTIFIRVGTDTDCWGKRYDYALPMLPNGTLVGLCKNPERDDVGKFTPHHMRAIKELVEGELGRVWDWDRLNHDNHRTVRRRLMFNVNIKVEITEDGKAFSNYDLNYHDMPYDKMQLLQATVGGALISLGNDGVKAETAKK